jgi:hypothetical protein
MKMLIRTNTLQQQRHNNMSQNKKRKTTDGEAKKKIDKSMLESMSRRELISLEKKVSKLIAKSKEYTVINGTTDTSEFALVVKRGKITLKGNKGFSWLNRHYDDYFAALENLYCEADGGSVFVYTEKTKEERDEVLKEIKKSAKENGLEFETRQVTFGLESIDKVGQYTEELLVLKEEPVSEVKYMNMDETLLFIGFK